MLPEISSTFLMRIAINFPLGCVLIVIEIAKRTVLCLCPTCSSKNTRQTTINENTRQNKAINSSPSEIANSLNKRLEEWEMKRIIRFTTAFCNLYHCIGFSAE